MIKKNKMLEDKLCALAIEVNSLKEHNEGNRENEEDPCEVIMLNGERANLRNKVLKEKQKQGKGEALKALREEVVALRLHGTRNYAMERIMVF